MAYRPNIAAVSYLNTLPFLYGLYNHPSFKSAHIHTCPPAECAALFENHEVDIALVPVAYLKNRPEAQIIPGFCIGSDGPVGSVLLVSKKQIRQIKSIVVDRESMTSNALVKILADRLWKIEPVFEQPTLDTDDLLDNRDAAVVIGDKALEVKFKYPFVYDLAAEWTRFSNLPFVFAVWISHEKPAAAFQKAFNKALKEGVDNRLEAVKTFNRDYLPPKERDKYITAKISYEMDRFKEEGLQLFLSLIK